MLVIVYGIVITISPINLIDRTSLILNKRDLIFFDFLILGVLAIIFFRPSFAPASFVRWVCILMIGINIIQLGPFFLSIPRFCLPYRVVYMQYMYIWPELLGFHISKFLKNVIFFVCLTLPYAFLLTNTFVFYRIAIQASKPFPRQ